MEYNGKTFFQTSHLGKPYSLCVELQLMSSFAPTELDSVRTDQASSVADGSDRVGNVEQQRDLQADDQQCEEGSRSFANEKVSWSTRTCSKLILNRLKQLKYGQLVIQLGCDQAVFGQLKEGETPAVVQVHSETFFKRLVFGGGLAAAESYMDGEWSSPDLTAVFRVLVQNESILESFRASPLSPISWVERLGHFFNRNSKLGSRKNIQEHYDLGNEFFQLFLDESMMYSSAIFESSDTPLVEASWEKVDRVCRTLRLTPKDHVLEIGTGWGGFAIHAASKYGCKVTTTTISEEQYAYAKQRVAEAGLEDRVTLLKSDYRDLSGQYDKLVSLEMIEAVGKKYLPGYFEKCDLLLKPGGAMMIQAITMADQRFEAYSRGVDFIQKYIFPGGFLPSITEMQKCVRDQTDLRMVQLDDFGMHYAKTLQHWNQRFHAKLGEVRERGFSERFIRMWRYYLTYCEAAFLERSTGLVQTMWVKPECSLGQDVVAK